MRLALGNSFGPLSKEGADSLSFLMLRAWRQGHITSGLTLNRVSWVVFMDGEMWNTCMSQVWHQNVFNFT